MALSAALTTLKDRLQLFSSEADSLTAICYSTIKTVRPTTSPSTVIVSNTSQIMRPPSSRPRLPPEVLDNIFSYLRKDHLDPLLYANRFISTVATRRLYHDVTLNRPAAIILFLNTIFANEDLQTLVRYLDISMVKSKEAHHTFTKTMLTCNFYVLLRRALRAMTTLTSLNLELPKAQAPVWLFDGCTFRLRQLTTSMYCRRPLARFLETQSGIEELTLRGYQTDTVMFLPFIDAMNSAPSIPADDVFALAPGALPLLRVFNAVHADANLIRAVVQNRPVTAVSVPLFPGMTTRSLDALLASGAPLKRLSVISFDPTAPGFLFEALGKRFPDLETLHLVMLMAEYNQELLEQSGVLLSNFKCLKYITFMAAPSRPTPQLPVPVITPAAPNVAPSTTTQSTSSSSGPSVADDGQNDPDPGEADIAKRWHHHCPTLRTIILPKGRVWFQSGPEGEGTTLPLGALAAAATAESHANVENAQQSSAEAGVNTSDGVTSASEGTGAVLEASSSSAVMPALPVFSVDNGVSDSASDGPSVSSSAMDMPILSLSMEHGVSEVAGTGTNTTVETEWSAL